MISKRRGGSAVRERMRASESASGRSETTRTVRGGSPSCTGTSSFKSDSLDWSVEMKSGNIDCSTSSSDMRCADYTAGTPAPRKLEYKQRRARP
ncbi:hypothetical protein K438DRAFT_1803770 [Mycena galopus ATCC 62051]|nr:hypothetical protein K438DRAFT_1803770 [Mycena galopus ATCC 62051]